MHSLTVLPYALPDSRGKLGVDAYWFIIVNFAIQSFTYSEFTSLAISKVWSGHAYLPARERLWQLYNELVKKVGYGKHFQFLGSEGLKGGCPFFSEHGIPCFDLRIGVCAEKMRFFQGWLNAAAVKYGGRQIDGMPEEYVSFCYPVV